MKFGAIKGLIGAVAPTIGQALGGPLGGTAAQAIAQVLGCKPDEKSIEKAVQNATPEQLAEIKKAKDASKEQLFQLVENIRQKSKRLAYMSIADSLEAMQQGRIVANGHSVGYVLMEPRQDAAEKKKKDRFKLAPAGRGLLTWAGKSFHAGWQPPGLKADVANNSVAMRFLVREVNDK